MPKVTFIEHDGSVHTFEVSSGQSLMQVAMSNRVPNFARLEYT